MNPTDQNSRLPPLPSGASPPISAEDVSALANMLLGAIGDQTGAIRDQTGAIAPLFTTSFAFTSSSTQSQLAQDPQRPHDLALALLAGLHPTGSPISLGAPLQGLGQEQAPALPSPSLLSLPDLSSIGEPEQNPGREAAFQAALFRMTTDGSPLYRFALNQGAGPGDLFGSALTFGDQAHQRQIGEETQHQLHSPSGAPGRARRGRQDLQSSHPYQPASSPPQHLSAASSAASGQNTPTFFWLGPDSGWIFPPKPVEGAQRPQIGQDILAQCSTCGSFVLPTPDVIASHQKLHGGNGNLPCGYGDKCHETFTHLKARTTHLTRAHSIYKEEHCPVCQGGFQVQDSRSPIDCLQEHIWRRHFDVEAWKCLICNEKPRHGGVEITTLFRLYKHYTSKHREDPTTNQEIKAHYINLDTGLPWNAHYFTTDDGKTKIAIYPKDIQPPNPHPVDWTQATIKYPSPQADQTKSKRNLPKTT